MERLTSNRNVSDMSMVELAHNSCYRGKDGWARYRDYDMDIDARELARHLQIHADVDDAFEDDGDFEESMIENLQYGLDDAEGLIATFYRNLWAMADLRERLKYYEDLEEQGKLLKLPFALGDVVWTNDSRGGLSKETRPYEAKITFIGIEEKNCFLNVAYTVGRVAQFKFSDLGKKFFLTREEAEASLMLMEDKKEIVTCLKVLLNETREGEDIKMMELTEDEHFVMLQWASGSVQKVNIAADSGVALISDVIRAII